MSVPPNLLLCVNNCTILPTGMVGITFEMLLVHRGTNHMALYAAKQGQICSRKKLNNCAEIWLVSCVKSVRRRQKRYRITGLWWLRSQYIHNALRNSHAISCAKVLAGFVWQCGVWRASRTTDDRRRPTTHPTQGQRPGRWPCVGSVMAWAGADWGDPW